VLPASAPLEASIGSLFSSASIQSPALMDSLD